MPTSLTKAQVPTPPSSVDGNCTPSPSKKQKSGNTDEAAVMLKNSATKNIQLGKLMLERTIQKEIQRRSILPDIHQNNQVSNNNTTSQVTNSVNEHDHEENDEVQVIGETVSNSIELMMETTIEESCERISAAASPAKEKLYTIPVGVGKNSGWWGGFSCKL